VGSSQLDGGGWREVAIPVTSLGEGNTYTSHYTIRNIIISINQYTKLFTMQIWTSFAKIKALALIPVVNHIPSLFARSDKRHGCIKAVVWSKCNHLKVKKQRGCHDG
jgi:hypothetical protein